MSLILSIESGTEICSVALSRDGEVIALRDNHVGRDHARLVATFVDELLKECGVEATELDAVAVSKGPGSYTGLRIGVSLAKGLCYGLNIPLIGVGSLEALLQVAIERCEAGELQGATLIPMVDARRMEVYTQQFDSDGVGLSDVTAKVIDESSFEELRDGDSRVILFGDGASKCAEVLPWAKIIDVKPSAVGVAKIAHSKLNKGECEDVAYFEPFYLKDVVITKSKRKFF
ncbi:MAG: tRNA (adenosine(37)-N6)-threonylcarbamoyltransferase complex dimerization subunit type 1 TsaB [Rikenellaceae bacterium]